MEKDSHPFHKDMAGRDGMDKNEISIKRAISIASDTYNDPIDTKTLTPPSWADNKGKTVLVLLIKAEIGRFCPHSLEGLDRAWESSVYVNPSSTCNTWQYKMTPII